MSSLIWLVPIALGMGAVALLAFLWSMRSGQYADLDGAAERRASCSEPGDKDEQARRAVT